MPPKRVQVGQDQQPKRVKKSQKEVDLEALVFGADLDDYDVLNYMGHESVHNTDDFTVEADLGSPTEEQDAFAFSIDTGDNDAHMDFMVDVDPSAIKESTLESIDDEVSETESIDMPDIALNETGVKAAWEDEDDEKMIVSLINRNRLRKLRVTETETEVKGDEYQRRLRQRFQQLNPKPTWALTASERTSEQAGISNKDEDGNTIVDSDDEQQGLSSLLAQSASLLSKTRVHLPSGRLDVERVKDVSQPSNNKVSMVAVDFHPNGQVMLIAGSDKTLRLYQIDGKRNEKIQSVLFKDLRISCAKFDHTGRYIVVTGRRTYFYIYDVESGQISRVPQLRPRTSAVPLLADHFSISPDDRWIAFMAKGGIIDIVSLETRRWIGDIRVNKAVVDMAWSMDGHHLYVLSTESEVYRWDIETLGCVHRFHDDGGYAPTCLAVSSHDRYLAIGSHSGMVNIYDQSCLDQLQPKPLKTMGNLTTPVHGLEFSSDAQLLCMFSKSKKDQLRMIHTSSLSVFSNWPTPGTPLSHVQSVDFSPHTGYLAIGNDKGRTLLYRMRHYGQA